MKIIYLLLAVCAVESAAFSQDDEVSANCPNDLSDTTAMKFFNGTCYQFVSQEKYWPQARDFCLLNGGRLVKVNDPQINQFIVDSLNALSWRNQGVWIGLNDIATEMQWQWTGYERHANEPLQWSNWGRGHPGAFLHSHRDCVRMVRGGGDWKWHETLCNTMRWHYRFICEYSSTDNALYGLASNGQNKRSRTRSGVDSTGSRSSLGRPSKKIHAQQKTTAPTRELPVSDGLFHLYALPVGQGNSLILQCPNGDIAIVDLGGVSSQTRRGFWSTKEIKDFLQKHHKQIKNIVITHNDIDHYSFFKDVFPTSNDLPYLININISCTFDRLPEPLRTWITDIGASEKVRTFNNGHRCGHMKNETCGKITLCPENPEIKAEVLSANAGSCVKQKANIDSIVIGITFNKFKMHLSGDFEDCTKNQNENGPQKTMVEVYGNELNSTVYMLSHHGANRCANKEVMLDAVQPKAVFASSDPFRQNFRHPKCSITDYLKRKNYLCKPMDSSCGQHPMENTILDYKLQQIFTCGEDYPITVFDNEFAIYSTTPSEDTINLVHLLTDGVKWGFINGTQPRINQ